MTHFIKAQQSNQATLPKSATLWWATIQIYEFVGAIKKSDLLILSMSKPLLSSEEEVRFHYRWLWATMWLLGIELRSSGRAVSALNHWAISIAHRSHSYSNYYTMQFICKEWGMWQAVVAHNFNLSNWEAEAGVFLSSRPCWSTEWVPGQPRLYRETLSQKIKQTNKQKTNKQTNKRFYLFYIHDEYTVAVYRGHWIPLQMAVSHHVVAGNWTQDLWKSNQCS